MILQKIIKQIKGNQSFLVVAHENPDGDAIGSTLGLALALREMGKDVIAFNVDTVPDSMGYLPQSEIFRTELPDSAAFDVAFVLDSGDVSRTGLPVKDICTMMINIDHHPHSTFGDLCYLDTAACATAVMIYRLLDAAGHQVSRDVATALYLVSFQIPVRFVIQALMLKLLMLPES